MNHKKLPILTCLDLAHWINLAVQAHLLSSLRTVTEKGKVVFDSRDEP